MSTKTLINGAQLSAARALAGLTQTELAELAGLHPNSIRYLERQQHITTRHSSDCVKSALLDQGVACFAEPTAPTDVSFVRQP